MFSFEVVQFNPTLKWIQDPGLNHISLKNPPLTVERDQGGDGVTQ